jgi:uncharacterized protein YjdB
MPVPVRTAIALCVAALGCGGSGGGGSTGPAPIESISVSLTQSSILVGDQTSATATARDASGNALFGRTMSWSSTNSAVATVDATGVVNGIGAGTAGITATSEGRSGTATVTVDAVPVAAVTVSLGSSTLEVGSTTQATATTTDKDGTVLNGRTVSWSSDNTAVATVSSTGIVTAVQTGSAAISGTSEGKSGLATITVGVSTGYGSSAEKIRVVDIGTTFTPTLSGSSAGTTTFVSRATSVATVDAQGRITGVGEGQVWVAATAPGFLADSVYVIVPRTSTGPLLRSDLTTFKVKPGSSIVVNVVLDTRSTPIGGTEFTIGFTFYPTLFTGATYAATGSPTPVVSNLQPALLRVSLASGSPLSGELSMVRLSFTTANENASGFLTFTLLDLASPTGTDLLPVATSTRIPIIIHD